MKPRTKMWLHGLIGGLVGGFAGALDSSIALMIVAPKQFNLGPELWETIKAAAVLGALVGIKMAFAYLKQSPLPPTGDTEFLAKKHKHKTK